MKIDMWDNHIKDLKKERAYHQKHINNAIGRHLKHQIEAKDPEASSTLADHVGNNWALYMCMVYWKLNANHKD